MPDFEIIKQIADEQKRLIDEKAKQADELRKQENFRIMDEAYERTDGRKREFAYKGANDPYGKFRRLQNKRQKKRKKS
jgi:hypothetical protein